jgi:oligopeptide/dipeptide ABC transporter ATP-binding protein
MSAAPLFSVAGLGVELRTTTGNVWLTQDVTLEITQGSTLGLVGESGSGKTITSLAIMGLLPNACRIGAGSVRLNGRELVGLTRREIGELQATEMAMVFQDGARSLHPAFTVGNQIAAVARQHLGLSKQGAMRRAIEMLDAVGIKEPAKRAAQYPHTYSGGMCQRAMIAMALVCTPKLLIADEPTTALDVTVQAQVLRLIRRLQREMNLGVLFITHDMGVVAEMCDRVAVMYAGQIVEEAQVTTLFERPRHPYTRGLLDSIPTIDHRGRSFGFIPGAVPNLRALPPGCRFSPRCPHSVPELCDTECPSLRMVEKSAVRCRRAEAIESETLARERVA